MMAASIFTGIGFGVFLQWPSSTLSSYKTFFDNAWDSLGFIIPAILWTVAVLCGIGVLK